MKVRSWRFHDLDFAVNAQAKWSLLRTCVRAHLRRRNGRWKLTVVTLF